LAVEYAYRHRSEFDTVWWVRAEEPATLVSDYAALATALGLPEATLADQQHAALAARRWLDTNERWLLVLDNAQAPDSPTGLSSPLARLVDLLPQVLYGQVLVTSRDASWEHYASLAELEVFVPMEAVTFLLARSGSSDQAAAAQIADLLGSLPLALEQAGAYIRETGVGLAAYLERLRQFPALALARGEPRDRDPSDTVATTWRVSLDRVQTVPGAVDLLEVCAFLGPDEIPRELFTLQLDPPGAEFSALAADPFALDDAVAALRRFGLVKASESSLTIHRLLQQVIRDRLDPATATSRAALAVRLLAETFPSGGLEDPGVWPVCARLLPHAVTVASHAAHYQAQLAATSELLDNAARYLHGRARYSDARRMQERALAIREAALGSDHPTTAASLSNLAVVLADQGDLDGARRMQERALAIREAALGSDHPTTAANRQELATVVAKLKEQP
jgi:tetratricopeptide (TPR) repeat protein